MLEILRKFFRFCDERERSEFYRSIVLGVLAALFSALKIPAIGVMLQAILVEGVTAKTILLSLAVMLISVIGSSILKYRATALQTDGGYSTTANKRVQIAEHLRYLPMGYFNENSLGAITSVTTNTMDNLSGVSTRVVMLVTEGIFSTAVMTLAVFLFDWRVGLFIIAGLAVYYAVNHALQIRSEQTTRRKFAGDTAVVEQVLEFIKGIAEVKSYSLIGRYNRRLEDTIEENVNANTDMELKLLPLMLTQNVVAKLIDMGVVVLSLILYTGGRMELLNCVMLCICSFLLTEGLEQAGTQSSLLRVVDTCVDQAADILDLPAMDISGAELTPEHHDLHADHITFSYGEKQIIHGVTLDIPERTTTAIVGPSGGGKTTLCHLLSRFWDVDAGQVTLGGHDVRDYTIDGMVCFGLYLAEDGYYYYFGSGNYTAVKNTRHWVSFPNDTGLAQAFYDFDENGRMIIDNPDPSKNGIVNEDGTLYYYVNGVRNYAGLIQIDGDYYYVNSSCKVVTSQRYWVSKTNDLLPATFYNFDADGKMTDAPIPTPDPDPNPNPDPEAKNGIVSEDGELYYYVNGVKTYAGLIQIDGDYYYVNSSCKVVTNQRYWISKTNDLLPATFYTFGADGKMTDAPIPTPEPDPELKNGIINEDGELYYYVNGVKTYAGLIQIDGDYYYVNSSCKVVTNQRYWISKTNDLLPATFYTFGADGKMTDAPIPTPEPDPELKNGIINEDGELYYYVNGVKTYAGLIQIDGDYYYVNSSCKVVTNQRYWISKTNDLLPATFYTFGADGKMVK